MCAMVLLLYRGVVPVGRDGDVLPSDTGDCLLRERYVGNKGNTKERLRELVDLQSIIGQAVSIVAEHSAGDNRAELLEVACYRKTVGIWLEVFRAVLIVHLQCLHEHFNAGQAIRAEPADCLGSIFSHSP